MATQFCKNTWANAVSNFYSVRLWDVHTSFFEGAACSILSVLPPNLFPDGGHPNDADERNDEKAGCENDQEYQNFSCYHTLLPNQH